MKHDTKYTRDAIESLLRSVNMKATNPRVELLLLLANGDTPLSIKDITKKLTRKSIDQATVYRNLKELKEKELLRTVELGHGQTHYELMHSNDDHHHIICTVCGSIEDVDACEEELIKRKVLRKSNQFKSITHHSLEFFGVCNKCA